MTAETPLLVARDGAVLHLTFNRPKSLNALDEPMALALRDACRAAAADPSLRAVVIAGAGRAFMAGGDVDAMSRGDRAAAADRLIGPLHEALTLLTGMRIPVLASLHGAVAGAGLGVALACDLAIAADTAKFSFAYTRIGASPDGSTSWSLPRVIGLRRAMGLALLGDTVEAPEALVLGLVNRVVPEAALRDETAALARRLAEGPTDAFGRTKELLRASVGPDRVAQMSAERDAFLRGAGTKDFAEGVDAFLARRAPLFTGG